MNWKFRRIDNAVAQRLANDLGQPLKMGEFLAARKFNTAEEVLVFIKAEMKNIPSPYTLTDMDKAVERLLRARLNQETVAICGDYDADGLTASALLTSGLRELGVTVITHIPNRLTDGYGMKEEAIPKLIEAGATLIVTVDNGIAGHEAILAATCAGVDVIVTDHHRLPGNLPGALAVIDPHRDLEWQKSPPAGVGVAFFLLVAFKRKCQETGLHGEGDGPNLMDYLPLVAIGTVADLVPLTGVNHILVRHGLNFLASTKHPGLAALKKVTEVNGATVSARDVGFRLAPRLNAAGRLGSADPALELLLTKDFAQAGRLALKLEKINQERYKLQGRLFEEALERLEMEISSDSRTVVLAGNDWPRGLLGLAASRLVEASQKPTVLLSIEDGLAVGSGRSAGNFNLYGALRELEHLFISFGGHAQAAGMTLKEELLGELRDGLEEVAQEQNDFQNEVNLDIDLVVELGGLEALARPLASLEPFGSGNPAPLVVVAGAQINDARPTASRGEQHMRMSISDGLTRMWVTGFNLAPRLSEVERDMDVALRLDTSEFKGKTYHQWQLVDFRPASDRGITR